MNSQYAQGKKNLPVFLSHPVDLLINVNEYALDEWEPTRTCCIWVLILGVYCYHGSVLLSNYINSSSLLQQVFSNNQSQHCWTDPRTISVLLFALDTFLQSSELLQRCFAYWLNVICIVSFLKKWDYIYDKLRHSHWSPQTVSHVMMTNHLRVCKPFSIWNIRWYVRMEFSFPKFHFYLLNS